MFRMYVRASDNAERITKLKLSAVGASTGAFVAGLDAGHAYNTFPLMAGRIVPEEYWALPGWRNAFENTAAVQFHHRYAFTCLLPFGRTSDGNTGVLCERIPISVLSMQPELLTRICMLVTMSFYTMSGIYARDVKSSCSTICISLSELHKSERKQCLHFNLRRSLAKWRDPKCLMRVTLGRQWTLMINHTP